jgi:hypothetical protein
MEALGVFEFYRNDTNIVFELSQMIMSQEVGHISSETSFLFDQVLMYSLAGFPVFNSYR